MEDKLFLETWAIHNRINRYLLDAIKTEHLTDASASKGRSVGEQFAHLHNVRLMWLKQAGPALMGILNLQKIEKEAAYSKPKLCRAMAASGHAITLLLEESLKQGGKIKGFKPHAAAFLAYLISHESHHRGQIALSLKQSGHPLSKKTSFGLWEWGVR
jgi:uncharacterized damage-inducible protein DinB